MLSAFSTARFTNLLYLEFTKSGLFVRWRNHIFKLIGFVLSNNGKLQEERFKRVEIEKHLLRAHFVHVLASTHTVQETRQELHRHAITEVPEVNPREQVSNVRIFVTQRRGNRGNVPYIRSNSRTLPL